MKSPVVSRPTVIAGTRLSRFNLNCKTLDCLEVLSEVYRSVESLAKKRGITFTADTSVTLPPVVADRRRMIQVLTILLCDAIRNNIGRGWVMLAASPGGDMVRFYVRDVGRRVRPDGHRQMSRACDRRGGRTSDEERTRIGLATFRELIHAMKGEIGFNSVVGEGSEFWIDLPVAMEVPAAGTLPQAASGAPSGKSRFKILYIEDYLFNVELMRDIINRIDNAQFFDAQTVLAGINILLSVMPDLVITDIHLPDGSGFDVLRRVRSTPETAPIPVIALTGDAMPTNMNNMQRHDFDHILTKPFRVRELMNVVQATLRAG